MGTNYYHRTNICACCERYDEQHICKNLTMFQSVGKWQDEAPWGYDTIIGSWADWRLFLLTTPGEVWDEYGRQLSPAEFVRLVELMPMDARRRQYDYIAEYQPLMISHNGADGNGMDWLDPDGFSFSSSEFS